LSTKLNPRDFSTKWKVTLFFAADEADLAAEFDDPLALNTTTRTATPTNTTAANRRFTVTLPSSIGPPGGGLTGQSTCFNREANAEPG
jgi:hypothetical protein